MAAVKLVWSVKKVTVPAGTDLMQYRADIGAGTEQFVAFNTLEANFADVAPGDYIASVALSNADGSNLQFASVAAFTVPSPDVTLDSPDVITVSLS